MRGFLFKKRFEIEVSYISNYCFLFKGVGGVYPKKLDFLCLYIFERSSVKGSGTFYRIEKFYPGVEFSRVKVGWFSAILGKISQKGPKKPLKKRHFLELLLQFWVLKPGFLAIGRPK